MKSSLKDPSEVDIFPFYSFIICFKFTWEKITSYASLNYIFLHNFNNFLEKLRFV